MPVVNNRRHTQPVAIASGNVRNKSVASTVSSGSSAATSGQASSAVATGQTVLPTSTAISTASTNTTLTNATSTIVPPTGIASQAANGASLVVEGIDGLNDDGTTNTDIIMADNKTSNIRTVADDRKVNFKALADFARSKLNFGKKVEAKRREKQDEIISKARQMGSPKQPGEKGYVEQQVSSVEQQQQIEEVKKTVGGAMAGL